jgi:hypothetical protein
MPAEWARLIAVFTGARRDAVIETRARMLAATFAGA